MKIKAQKKQQRSIIDSYIIIDYREDKEQNEKQQEESINLQKLYELSNDFVWWLEIENINISYPAVQTESNRKDYYNR